MPYQSSNPYFVAPASSRPFREGLAGISKIMKDRAEFERERVKETQRRADIELLLGSAPSGKDKAYEISKLPEDEKKSILNQYYEFKSEAMELNADESAKAIASGESVTEVLRKRIELGVQENADTTQTIALAREADKGNDEAAILEAEKRIALKDGFKAVEGYRKLRGKGPKGSEAAPSKRGKMIAELEALPPDSPYRAGYEAELAPEVKGPKEQSLPTIAKNKAEYDKAVMEKGVDHWYTKSIKRQIEGDPEVLALTQEDADVHGFIQFMGEKSDAATWGRGPMGTLNRTKVNASQSQWALDYADIEKGGLPDDKKARAELAGMITLSEKAKTRGVKKTMSYLDKRMTGMRSFTTNMAKQVARVKEIKDELNLFDSRLLNVPRRLLVNKIKGSANQKKYELYIAEISREISKLATDAVGSVAAPTDAEIKRWDDLHDLDLPLGEMYELLLESVHAAEMRLESVTDEYVDAGDRIMRQGPYKKGKKPVENDPLGIR